MQLTSNRSNATCLNGIVRTEANVNSLYGAGHMVGVLQCWAVLSLCQTSQGKKWLEFVSKPFVFTPVIVWHLSFVTFCQMTRYECSVLLRPRRMSLRPHTPPEFAALSGEECQSSLWYLFPVLTGSQGRHVKCPERKELREKRAKTVLWGFSKSRFWSWKSEVEPGFHILDQVIWVLLMHRPVLECQGSKFLNAVWDTRLCNNRNTVDLDGNLYI